MGGRSAARPEPDYREDGLAAYHYYGRRRSVSVLDGLPDAARRVEKKRSGSGGRASGRTGAQRPELPERAAD